MGSGAESAVPALRKIAAKDHVLSLPVHAAAAVVRIRSGDREAIARIVAIMKKSNRTGRMVALDALADLGPLAKPALPHLEAVPRVGWNRVYHAAVRRTIAKIRGE